MVANLSPQEFVSKWREVTLKERSAAQEHFLDVCRLVGHPSPAEADPTGERFTFEAGAGKQKGGQGWADVWKKGFFAWEYKGKHADLDKAYQQLLQYREALLNPPLLIVSDIDTIVIHTNFTNTVKRVITLTLDDLLQPQGLAHLRAVFFEPDNFQAPQTTEQVTEAAAREFAKLASLLRHYGEDSHQIAHFLIRLLFCLFAEDIELLPKGLFSRLVSQTRRNAASFTKQLRVLFNEMSQGGMFGADPILHFDGGLFDDETVLALDSQGMDILAKVAGMDWSSIEPSILGTLFERSLDPSKRAQLGAHYTSREDILLIVEPVLMAPLRRRWAEVQAKARQVAARRDGTKDQGQRTRLQNELTSLLQGFAEEISQIRVLDPACGSGNFLYVGLKQLLDLWKEVSTFSAELGLPYFSLAAGQTSPSPAQLYGIEINPYAHELAQATVWIGYIQWLRDNGFGQPSEPILKPLQNIVRMDAVLAYDEQGKPVEPVWPEAEVVIGNPPFVGDKKMRAELGDEYVDNLRRLYTDRIPGQSDFVCYWFEKARALIEHGTLKRAGLLATQGIRGGANRRVLERIKQMGNIFWAQSDRDWILEGATVHVSMVGFDDGSETAYILDGKPTENINPDLTGSTNLTTAQRLLENTNISFLGDSKGGAFDIDVGLASTFLNAPLNPNGRPNSDVVRPWINGFDITQRSRQMWIIDFGVDMQEEEAALYEAPFEYIKREVKPKRLSNNRATYRNRWWIHAEPRPAMREAISSLSRYIVTSRVAKYRLFVWMASNVLADSATVVIARDDEYFFGVLQSRVHELWANAKGTQLREAESGRRYTPTSTFETFPFPWPPGQEPKDDPRVEAVTEAARELVKLRDNWLNPPDLSEAELKQRTLTNLYNQRPTWLDLAHRRLDRAVFAAYGWPDDLSDEEILGRLLALNLERAG